MESWYIRFSQKDYSYSYINKNPFQIYKKNNLYAFHLEGVFSYNISIDTTSNYTATNAGTYYVWYKAVGDDTHADSDPAYVTATIAEKPTPTPEPTVATAPVALGPTVRTSASASAGTMTVKWTWSSVKGAKSYKVAYRKAGSRKWTVKKTKKTKYVVKGQKIRGLYEYKVAAVTGAGDVWSGVNCRYFRNVKTKADAGKGTIKVSWKKDKSATGYQIKIATNKKMDNARIVDVASTETSYVISGLAKGSKYYVRVRPVKNSGGVLYKGILCKKIKVKVQ